MDKEYKQKIFDPVLEKGEEIVGAFKPNRKKFWWQTWLTVFVCTVWFFLVPIALLFDETGYVGVGTAFWVSFGIVMGITLITIAVAWLCGALWLKNTYYVYSDRRILIRTGIIGIDYKSLEYKSLNATVVRVSLIDKIVGKNTGTIKFGSPSSPVLNIWSGNSNQYMFCHIEKPYENMKIIKEHIHDVTEDLPVKKETK